MKTAEQIKSLSDSKLWHEMTECRISLESIYPFKCKEVSDYRNLLLAEDLRRGPSRKPAALPVVKTYNETVSGGFTFDGEPSFS